MNFDNIEELEKEHNIKPRNGAKWMNISEGDNEVRILSEFESLGKHFAGKGVRPITCVGLKNNCPKCLEMKKWEEENPNEDYRKNPHRPTVKCYMWVLDKKSEPNEIKILEVGYTVIKKIGSLKDSKHWGLNPETKLPDYDINIQKNIIGSKQSDVRYEVVPIPNKDPLEQHHLDKFKKLTPISKIIGDIKEKAKKSLLSNNDATKTGVEENNVNNQEEEFDKMINETLGDEFPNEEIPND